MEFAIQPLVTQGAVEALDMPVLPWAARLDVEGFYRALSQPSLSGAGDELAAVVAAKEEASIRIMLDRSTNNPLSNTVTMAAATEASNMVNTA